MIFRGTYVLKCMIYHQLADILYLSDQGIPTKRRIKFLQIKGDCVQAYCYLRNATQLFKIKNILALIPVYDTRREVV